MYHEYSITLNKIEIGGRIYFISGSSFEISVFETVFWQPLAMTILTFLGALGHTFAVGPLKYNFIQVKTPCDHSTTN